MLRRKPFLTACLTRQLCSPLRHHLREMRHKARRLLMFDSRFFSPTRSERKLEDAPSAPVGRRRRRGSGIGTRRRNKRRRERQRIRRRLTDCDDSEVRFHRDSRWQECSTTQISSNCERFNVVLGAESQQILKTEPKTAPTC